MTEYDPDDCEMCYGTGEIQSVNFGDVPCPNCSSQQNEHLRKRVKELEAQRPIIPAPRIHVHEGDTIAYGKRWFYSVHIGHVPVSNNHSAPTEAEACECANKAVEFYLNRLTGKSSEWGSY